MHKCATPHLWKNFVPMLDDILRPFGVVPIKQRVEYEGSLNPVSFLHKGRNDERPYVVVKMA